MPKSDEGILKPDQEAPLIQEESQLQKHPIVRQRVSTFGSKM